MALTYKVYSTRYILYHMEDLGSKLVKAEADKMHILVDGLFQYQFTQFVVIKMSLEGKQK